MIRPGLKCFFATFCLATFLISCKDFIEPSIEKRPVNLQAPSNGYQSKLYKINFWWDGVEDALKYRLQVTAPGFSNTERLVLDTLVAGNKFSVNIDPGKYQWRLRAENGSSATEYSAPRNFEILFSSIKEQSVQLVGPADGLLTNNARLDLAWGMLYGATRYRLQVDTNGFVNESALVMNEVLPGTSFPFNVTRDQTYQWRVRAENDTAQARWSSINRFTVDRVPPARVKAVAPAENTAVSKPVLLQWEGTAGAVRYRLYVLKADSVTNYSDSYPINSTDRSYNFQEGSSGERIYWKVAAIDAAGNMGAASPARSFVIR